MSVETQHIGDIYYLHDMAFIISVYGFQADNTTADQQDY